VITLERPGFGITSWKRTRTLADYPNDVLEVANALRITKFAVVGYSMGGPYALACSRYLPPNRLTNTAIVNGVVSLDTKYNLPFPSLGLTYTICYKDMWSIQGMRPSNQSALLLGSYCPSPVLHIALRLAFR
jgi:pimeloyl-ACP methyl ester carboxylesterase